jgi:hypothetical protein
MRANPIYGFIGNRNKSYYRNVYLQSEHWKNLRKEKLEKNPVCEDCGTPFSLDVHHKQYRDLFDVRITDLETLCRICHNKEHRKLDRKKWKKKNKGFKQKTPKHFDLRVSRKYDRFDHKPAYLSPRNKRKQEAFDREHKNLMFKEMDTYVSIHY